LWDIADTALGDGSRSSEIIDLNWQLRSPRDVRQGNSSVSPPTQQCPLTESLDPKPQTTPHPTTTTSFPGAQGEFPEIVAETMQLVRAPVGAATAAPASARTVLAAIVDAGDVTSTPGSTQPSAPPNAKPLFGALDDRDVVAVQRGTAHGRSPRHTSATVALA